MWRAVVLLSLPFLLACTRRLPSVEINTLWRSNLSYFAPVDLDGDSTDELLVAGSDHVVNRFDQDLRSVGSTQYLEKGTLQPVGNLIGGTDSEHLWLTFKRHDSLYLQALSGHSSVIAVGKDSLPPGGWDGYAGAVVVADIENDTKLEAVVSVVSAMDARPRGIFVLDWLTGSLKWKYETGPAAIDPVVRDVDRDGKSEILFGSGALRNGNIANGTTDDSSYVFLLAADGGEVWRTRIGHYSSTVFAAWLDDRPEGTPQVLAWEKGNVVEERSSDSLFVLDGMTGVVRRRAGFGVFTNCAALAVDRKGKMRAVVAGSDNMLRLLDASLRVVRRARTATGVRHVLAGSFSCPRASEFMVVTDDGYLRVMDQGMNPLGEIRLGAGGLFFDVTPVRYHGRDRLLMHEADGDKSNWSLLDVVPLPVTGLSIPLVQAVSAVAGLTFAFAMILLGFRYRQTRDMRLVVLGLTGQAGVVEIGKRGQVRHTNQKARELLGGEALPAGPLVQAAQAALAEPPGATPKELPVALRGGMTVLARAARVRSGVMLTLEDISAVEYLQRVKAWAPVAQKLAHGIKNPLGTIMGAVEQIEIAVDRGRPKAEGRSQKTEGRSAEGGGGEEVKIQRPEAKSQDEEQRADEKVKKYVGYVKDEVTRLKKMTDAFMRFTKLNPPALEPRNMNELVRKVVAKYEGAMAKGISLELNLDDNLPPVALDEEGMANVLDIVIENAIEAMSTGRGSTTKAPRHQGSLVRASDSELTTKTQRHEAPERASTDCTDSRDGSARTPGPVNPGTPQRVLRIRTAVWSPATKTPRHEGSDTTPTDYADYTDSQTRTPGPLDPRAHVSIEVEDTGPGVPEKYLDKVFEPYFTHGKVDGTGLGLALAKKIVEDHKGRMEITSKEGEGTTVSIVLPTAGNGE